MRVTTHWWKRTTSDLPTLTKTESRFAAVYEAVDNFGVSIMQELRHLETFRDALLDIANMSEEVSDFVNLGDFARDRAAEALFDVHTNRVKCPKCEPNKGRLHLSDGSKTDCDRCMGSGKLTIPTM